MTRAEEIMVILREGPRESREIAVALGMPGTRDNAINVNSTLRRLEKAGYVKRWRVTPKSPWIWGPAWKEHS